MLEVLRAMSKFDLLTHEIILAHQIITNCVSDSQTNIIGEVMELDHDVKILVAGPSQPIDTLKNWAFTASISNQCTEVISSACFRTLGISSCPAFPSDLDRLHALP